MTEKRHFRSSPRPQIACKVTLYRSEWADGSPSPIVSYTRDIGTGGLFAETEIVFEIGDHVDVVLATPSTWEPLILKAEVCRCCGASEAEPGGVALRFIEMTDAQAVALADFTTSLDFDG